MRERLQISINRWKHNIAFWFAVARDKIESSEGIQKIKFFIFSKTTEEAGYNFKDEEDLKVFLSPAFKTALKVFMVGIGFFVVWGGLAPLDSAVTANGQVVLSGNHKLIQHEEGGRIREIFVKDGDHVTQGQVLIKIDDTQISASLQITKSRLMYLLAEQARLRSQQENLDTIRWNLDEFFEFESHELDQVIAAQNNLFAKTKLALLGQIEVLKDRIAQKNAEIVGAEAQLKSAEANAESFYNELKAMQELEKKGLSSKIRVMSNQRQYDDIVGKVGQIHAIIAAAQQSIAESNVLMLNVQNEYLKITSNELQENHNKLSETIEQYQVAKDKFEKTEIKATGDGIVTELQYHNAGAVITQQGHKIMSIVPQDDKLIIEAHLMTQDIDSVHVGLVAKIQFGAFKSRIVPRVTGTVIYVSPDKIQEQQHNPANPSGQYYLVKIEVNEKEFARINSDVKMAPGMPATVFIVKGTRTMLQYLLSPIMDSFHRAFKEA